MPDQTDLRRVSLSETGITYTFAERETQNPILLLVLSFLQVDALRALAIRVSEIPFLANEVRRQRLGGMRLLGLAQCLGSDPNDPNWYVVCAHHNVFVHYGEYMEALGRKLWGPKTKKECDDWQETNYPSLYCP